MKNRSFKYSIIFLLLITVSILIRPYKVNGEVQSVTEANEKLKGISEEEQQTLEKLFLITQEIEEMEREKIRLSKEIEDLKIQIDNLDQLIEKEKENYDNHLSLLEQVLISYQRGGPASYIDIILKSKDLTSFIKSLNLIKDISKNTGELLASIDESKRSMEENRRKLSESRDLLEVKKVELEKSIAEGQRLVKDLEAYLNSLEDQKELYEDYLNNLKLMWENLKDLFSNIVDEFSRIIGEGHFTMEDLNLKFNFFSVKGSIHQDTFNRILNYNSNLQKMIFSFGTDGVRVEVPESNLVLLGDFVIRDDMVLEYVPREGTFYNMVLEIESIEELFRNRPMIIDFEKIAGDMITIDIKLDEVKTEDGYLYFTLDTGFLFN